MYFETSARPALSNDSESWITKRNDERILIPDTIKEMERL
jgi:hypothetical protein